MSIVGTSEASVTWPVSSAAFTRAVSKRSWSTAVVAFTAERTRIDRPATWWTGSGQSQRSSGSVPSASADARALAARFSRVSVTAFGSPVVPEVWITSPARSEPRASSGGAGAAGSSGTATAPARQAAWSSSLNAMPGGSAIGTAWPGSKRAASSPARASSSA